MLLGVSPSQVERPSTPSDVVASLGSTLSRGASGLVPNGVALEVAPYWLLPSWGLTWDDYNQQWWAAFYRTFSLSVGTVSSSLPTSDPGSYTDLGVGARSQLLMGRPRNDCTRAVAEYRKLAGELTRALILPDEVEKEFRDRFGFGSDAYNQAINEYQAGRRKSFDQKMPRVYETCDAAGRVGFVLDAAGAFAWRFTQSDVRRPHRESGACRSPQSVALETRATGRRRVDRPKGKAGAGGAGIDPADAVFLLSDLGIHRPNRPADLVGKSTRRCPMATRPPARSSGGVSLPPGRRRGRSPLRQNIAPPDEAAERPC